MDKLKLQTHNQVDENIKRIAELFPNCLTERLDENGKPEVAIDFDQLRQELSKDIVEGPEERYQFTWPDKRNAIRLANAPTTDTLRPCREESVDFDNTQNLYIEGDNLEVLKLLRENYLGKVKMIYIDPPYNTGNDFVYNDDFAQTAGDYVHNSGQEDEGGNRLVANTESNGRFHTDWLNMIYPRLKVAKDLLSEDGVIFISIDDNEVENLRKVCDEVYGEDNFVSQIVWQKSKKGDAKLVSVSHEYIVTYVKSQRTLIEKGIKWRRPKQGLDEIFSQYNELRAKYGSDHSTIQVQMKAWYNSLPPNHPALLSKHYCYSDDRGLYFADNFAGPNDGRANRPRYDIIHPITGLPCKKPSTGWRWDEEHTKAALAENPPLIHFGPTHETIPCRKSYLKDVDTEPFASVFYKDGRSATLKIDKLLGKGVFDFPKDDEVIKNLVELVQVSDDDIVLDFFSGSATTAHAVMQLNAEDGGNRRFIMVQLPEATDEKSEAYKAGYKNICEIGKERIRRAGKKIVEELEKKKVEEGLFAGSSTGSEARPLDIGFRVLKLDSSNMQDVYYSPEQFNENLLFEDNIKPDRTDEDLLFQAMIELGIELSAKVEKREIAGKTVWSVADNYLMACFDKDVNETTITEIARQHPYYFVLRDSSLATDNVADNFEQIWEEYSKDTIRKIL